MDRRQFLLGTTALAVIPALDIISHVDVPTVNAKEDKLFTLHAGDLMVRAENGHMVPAKASGRGIIGVWDGEKFITEPGLGYTIDVA